MSTLNVATISTDYANTVNALSIGNSSSNMTLNSTSIVIGSNVVINTTAVLIGNATVNSVFSASGLTTNSITINGTNQTTVYPISNYQSFVANGTWTKPSWAVADDMITLMMWGGGGAGSSLYSAGGGGGACVIVNMRAGSANAVCNVVVGPLADKAAAQNGSNSVFWTNTTFSITAYGGAGASGPTSTAGGGGGWFGVGNTTVGGAPLGANSLLRDSTFGGGFGGPASGGRSVYGGGGGGQSSNGGASIYGGGGGSVGTTSGAPGGVSIFGGNGGGTGTFNGFAPGGGGGYDAGGAGGTGNGAIGEVRVWITRTT